jgi:CheY-like chemotaxis protein
MPTQPLNILLVEDHAGTNQVMTRMLLKAGHKVSAANNGESALELCRQQVFDLLICDIGLPDTNGWELLKKVHASQPGLRAIALTGYGFPNDVKRSTQVGFERHITKPPEWPVIQATISSMFPDAGGTPAATQG